MEVTFDTRPIEGATEVVWVYFPEVGHVYPIAEFTCCLCHSPVWLSEVAGGSVTPTRINGDSRYGYELMHRRCARSY